MNLKKIIFILIGVFLVIVFLLVFNRQQEQGNDLEVVFLNVGQGDAILIKTPYDQQILIDGGPDNKIINELSRNMSFSDHDLDLVILTHPHADHVTGLIEVLKRFEVKKVLHTGVLHTSPDYLAFLAIIKEKDLNSEIVKARHDLVLGPDLKLDILYPLVDLSGQRPDNLNNTSIVARLVYQDFRVLLTGDAESAVEAELMTTSVDLKAQVLKAGHHGSNTASSPEFLDLIKPEAAVIQSGADNDFGHPHFRTLKNLKQRDVQVWRNDLNGQIRVVSDGRNYQIFPEF